MKDTIYLNDIEKEILYLGTKVDAGDITNVEAADRLFKTFGIRKTDDAFRLQHERLKAKIKDKQIAGDNSEGISTTFDGNGGCTLSGLISLPPNIKSDPILLMEYLGMSKDKYSFKSLDIRSRQVTDKKGLTKELFAVTLRLGPIKSVLTLDEALAGAQEAFNKNIKPYDFTKVIKKIENTVEDKLIFYPAMELHLGKVGYDGGKEIYNIDIAKRRFFYALSELIHRQQTEKCKTLLLTIGNDFFNSDTTTYTTTAGTPQTNSAHWRFLFITGTEMYKVAIEELLKHFDKIEVQWVPGNHDTMSSFYLFQALSNYFSGSDNIKFSETFNNTQEYKFGESLIVSNHGDKNVKGLIETIAFRFRELWGQVKYVYLFTGHKHTKGKSIEKAGIVHYGLSSTSGKDEWHDENSYIASIQQQQYFIFDKNKGLIFEGNVITDVNTVDEKKN